MSVNVFMVPVHIRSVIIDVYDTRIQNMNTSDNIRSVSFNMAFGEVKKKILLFQAHLVLLGMAALVACRPDGFLDISLEDIHHEAAGAGGQTVTGSYSWISPDGTEYFVKYVADKFGYRVVESNAIPVSGTGVRANGRQVLFDSPEVDSRESPESVSHEFFD
ncbi:uncharacterized protein LOC143017509 [Oratosquilla oratoria]|uniref:uncharacterized protein LOC143017509 n=1 Tax=Oratosquilla oratoria TaxID=337810 RepID=UPI003F767D98